MNKKCKYCGSIVPADSNFCTNCGAVEFVEADINDTAEPSFGAAASYPGAVDSAQGVNPYSAQYNGQTFPNTASPKPAKKKTGLIIAIVAIALAGLLLLAGIIFSAVLVYRMVKFEDFEPDVSFEDSVIQTAPNDDFDFDEYNSEAAPVEYTKGEFDGVTYINKWADLKADLPTGYSNADSELYAQSENEVTDCGLYWMADDTRSFIYVCYEKLPSLFGYDESDYLDIMIDQFEKQLESADPEIDDDDGDDVDDIYTTKVIAGRGYVSAEYWFNNGYGDFCCKFYVRKIDDRMVVISSVAETSEKADELANIFTTAD